MDEAGMSPPPVGQEANAGRGWGFGVHIEEQDCSVAASPGASSWKDEDVPHQFRREVVAMREMSSNSLLSVRTGVHHHLIDEEDHPAEQAGREGVLERQHSHRGSIHIGPTILQHYMIAPMSVIFIGVCFALFVPVTYQYPRDGIPSTIMPSHGEEICGFPRLLGGDYKNASRNELSFFARSRAQVFDVKLMAEIDALCGGDDDRPSFSVIDKPPPRRPWWTRVVRDKGSPKRSKASLWIQVVQLGDGAAWGVEDDEGDKDKKKDKVLFRRMIDYECSGALLERIITIDVSRNQDYAWGVGGVLVKLGTNSTREFPITFEVMEMGFWGRYRPHIAFTLLFLVYIGIFSEVVHRALCTIIGSVVSLVILALFSQAPTMKVALSWMSETTLALLFGMTIMLNYLADTGVLEYAAVSTARFSNGVPFRLLLCLSFVTGVVSIALPNLAVVALIVPVTISVCNILSLDPVPYVIMETIMSTMGSTMTTITNPPNIIIANGLEEDGVDVISFITNVGLGVVITIPFLVVGMCFMFPDIYRAKRVHMDVAALLSRYSIKDHRLMNQTGAILASAIGLMFLSPVHGLDPSWFAFGGALTSLTLSSSGDIFKRLILVEWDTLFYLAGLFVIMEACHRLRLVDFIGDGMVRLIEQAPPETRLPVALLSILWIVTIISGLLDTVPLAIALVKVIALVASKLSLPVPALAWALAFGACLGQNSTIVGGANNVLAVSICERAGHGVSSRRWMSIGIPVVIITQTVITFYILIRYTSMPIPL